MSLLMKSDPFPREIDRLFGRLFDASEATQRWAPAMDLIEAEDHYLLKADLPGMSEDDVAIEFERGILTISGERKAEHADHGEGWHRIERASGRFSRQLSVPDGVDAETVTADFDRGVLSVRIPKPERAQPRRIAIGGSSANGNGAVEGTAHEK
jgi:HSP20 family protein